ncbi:MAG: carbamoyl-phosphate synthase large subunit [Bacteroidetes bacterium]|nr:MAG: carbamoyl-phosphate synthase large subunit [Bacteroidota bacterium]
MSDLSQRKLLIANRGEIAMRIARSARTLGLTVYGLYARDEARAPHLRSMHHGLALSGEGPAAYLNAEEILHLALEHGIDLIHPGYGFLSEQATFARQCSEKGLTFVGPSARLLEVLGDKISAREVAIACDLPTLPGSLEQVSLEQAREFFRNLPAGTGMMLKPRAGGGGRGIRVVHSEEELEAAYRACQSEARRNFGTEGLYVEMLLPHPRHIELQLIGDQQGQLMALGFRDCSIQRRYQKLVEITPPPGLSAELLDQIAQATLKMARKLKYHNLGTFEFLLAWPEQGQSPSWFFMEANPRLQVEHTITEAVYGIDLVRVQLLESLGYSLQQAGLDPTTAPRPHGYAIQCRINAEQLKQDGSLLPASGSITNFELPAGPGLRVDHALQAGLPFNSRYDSLLAKLIAHVPQGSFSEAVHLMQHALAETRISGISHNLPLLRNLLAHPLFEAAKFDTAFLSRHAAALIQPLPAEGEQEQAVPISSPEIAAPPVPEGMAGVYIPITATILNIYPSVGQRVAAGQELAVVEAMKMESVIVAEVAGVVVDIFRQVGDVAGAGSLLMLIEPDENAGEAQAREQAPELDAVRRDLEELRKRKAYLYDQNRPEAVAKRRKHGQYTARENIAALCDADSFVEYGSLAIAAQRKRRELEDLMRNTPADGLITGFGSINGELFGQLQKCLVMAYDFTVLAGTQGTFNHLKIDRMLQLANQWKTPVVIFAEGGGGRPGDVDFPIIAGLNIMTWHSFSRLRGVVPRLSIVSRYCFAGNAALAGCADVIIATENVSLGMGGPAMIEGGGLGRYHPAEVGPAHVQTANGVIDILVKDELEAVAAAKQYLSYFQGRLPGGACEDQRILRQLVPENRRRAYDVRSIIRALADKESVLELRPHFGQGIITALLRIEGHPMGLIANNPLHLGGAIDSESAQKACSFMELCNDFGLPLLSLCDTPGIMVGPEAEKSGTVRHASRLFVVGASLKVPLFCMVLRKGYGLGAMAMAGGSFHVPAFTVAWPTGEFGAMGLEGAVKLGFKRELEQAGSEQARQALYEQLLASMYERGKGTNMAAHLEIDEVIDPAESRSWILSGLQTCMAS